MALLWIDGFDHYYATGTTLVTPYFPYDFVVSGGVSYSFNTTMPELGGMAYNKRGGTANRGCFEKRLFPGTLPSGSLVGVGFHLYASSLASDGLVGLRNSADPFMAGMIAANGRVEIRATPTGTVLAHSGTRVLAINTLYHVETQFYIHATEGYVEIRINGTTWARLEGVNTMQSGGSDTLAFMPVYAGNTTSIGYLDNLYVYDGTGDTNNTWLGERNVYTLKPSADTGDAGWVPSTGTTGYTILDNVPATADYVEAASPGTTSTFDITDLPSTEISIVGIQTSIRAAKTGTAVTKVTANPVGAPAVEHELTQDQFLLFSQIDELDPDTGEPWTASAVNALQVTIERVT
jgi:hypothetical protein